MHQIVVICPECGTRNICSTESFPEYNFTCVGAGCEIDCSHYPQWTKSWEGNYEVFSVGAKSKASGLREQHPPIKSHKLLISMISLITLLVLTVAGVGLYGYVNRWESGMPHPQNSNLISSQYRGVWKSKRAGYKWVEGTAYDRWQSGMRHPDNSSLVSCEEEGKWKSTKAGYAWAGGSRIEWRAGLPHDEYAHWHSSDEEGKWTADSGYVEKNPSKFVSELVWKKGESHKHYDHWISSEQEGKWHTSAGYKKVYPNINDGSDSRAWLVKWSSGIEHPDYPNVVSGKKEGAWQPADGYDWVDRESEDDWRVTRKVTHRSMQPVIQQNGLDALNSMATILQECSNLYSLANSWPTDWRRVSRSANELLRECRKLQQSGFDSPDLREVIRGLLELKRKAEAELDDDDAEERAIRRATPKYA